MRQEFKVGEVAIVCNAGFHSKWNGEDVTVCTDRQILSVRWSDGTVVRRLRYGVMTRDGRRFAVEPWQLRKKRPREILSSWDRCPWQPQRRWHP